MERRGTPEPRPAPRRSEGDSLRFKIPHITPSPPLRFRDELEADHAGDQADQEGDLQRGDRLRFCHDPDHDGQRSADARPDGVGGAGRDAFHGAAQAGHAEYHADNKDDERKRLTEAIHFSPGRWPTPIPSYPTRQERSIP